MNDTITKQAVNPRGVTINFCDKSHRYWTAHRTPEPVAGDHAFEVDFVSVTTMLKKYFAPFDEKAMAEQVAAKRGVMAAQVMIEWQVNRDAACRFGTRTHEVCEDVLLGRPVRNRPENEKERATFEQGWRWATKAKERMKVVAVEQIVFHDALRIAGQIDFLMLDAYGTYWVMDWKTNKEIKQANAYGKTGLGPVAHLPECELSKYALQLSVYELILRSEGYIAKNAPVSRGLVHLTETDGVFIPTPDMAREVADIMIDHATALPF